MRGVFERVPGSGVWWIRYVDSTGRLIREKIGARRTAEKAYQLRKAQALEHRVFGRPVRDRTLTAWLAEYTDGRAAVVKSPSDLRRFQRLWTAELGATKLRQLSEAQVRAVIARRAAAVSRQTVAHEVGFLRRAVAAAVRDGLAESNPVPRHKAPRGGRVRYLTDEEESRLLAELTPFGVDLVLFAANTGLRQGEQFGLRWQHVDLDARLLRIPTSKTGEPRTVPLNETARAILRRQPRRLSDPRVFPTNCHNWQARQFQPAMQRAGIEDFRWHDLRHTFASRLVMGGVDLRTVADLLGHRSIQMTMRYAHLAPGHRASAVTVLNGRLHGKVTSTTVAPSTSGRKPSR